MTYPIFSKASFRAVGHWAWRKPLLPLDFRMGCMASGMERGQEKRAIAEQGNLHEIPSISVPG